MQITVNNNWKNQQTKTAALHLDLIMTECMQRTYDGMTEAQVREDVETELRTYVDNILDYDNCLHDLLVELLEDAIDDIDYDELVEHVMDGIDTDSLKREFIYTFYDSVSDTDIDVDAQTNAETLGRYSTSIACWYSDWWWRWHSNTDADTDTHRNTKADMYM